MFNSDKSKTGRKNTLLALVLKNKECKLEELFKSLKNVQLQIRLNHVTAHQYVEKLNVFRKKTQPEYNNKGNPFIASITFCETIILLKTLMNLHFIHEHYVKKVLVGILEA